LYGKAKKKEESREGVLGKINGGPKKKKKRQVEKGNEVSGRNQGNFKK